MRKGHIRSLLPPAAAARAAACGDPVGWCNLPGCVYGSVDAVHIQIRGKRTFLTVQCRRCRHETVLPWLARDDDNRWRDPHGRPCLADPTRLKLAANTAS